MLISCSKCGRIHERGFKCKNNIRQVYIKEETIASKFRNTKAWRDKRKDIINRDKALCQICIRNLHNTLPKQHNNNVQVHHMAEHGQITRKELYKIIYN